MTSRPISRTKPNRIARALSDYSEKLDYDMIRLLLHDASIHLKLVFGLTATRPHVSYLDTFSYGGLVARHDELSLTATEEERAFAALEHSATYLSAVQVHTALEAVHSAPFHIAEADIGSAFQIARLLRNAFAHNPFNPVWEIRGVWQERQFVVPDVITLDTTGLHGTSVCREHYGGPIAILRLIEYADKVIKLRGSENAAYPHDGVNSADEGSLILFSLNHRNTPINSVARPAHGPARHEIGEG
jgi:hypothetical protein